MKIVAKTFATMMFSGGMHLANLKAEAVDPRVWMHPVDTERSVMSVNRVGR